MTEYESVVGLEVHLELATASKVFCGCPTRFGAEPNSQSCPVCLGLPGSLPVLNRKVLEYGLRVALSLEGQISPRIKFDRKNYFYPDLPKNYQISQYDQPLSTGGFLEMKSESLQKKIRIRRVHIEEDTGKLLHLEGENVSLIDFNRSGIPLLEIVSEPDLRSGEEAHLYLTQLKSLLEYLEVSDCDMEKGSLRCDTNISVRKKGSEELGVKVEIKNLNSFRAVRLALDYERKRQIDVLESAGKLTQETRLWDAARNVTAPMRSKEYAHDYRYFPEPDLVPFVLTRQEIEAVRRSLPELPAQRQGRFVRSYGLSDYDARLLTMEKALSEFFERAVSLWNSPKRIANWMMGPFLERLKSYESLSQFPVTPERLVELLRLVETGTLTQLSAKQVFERMVETGGTPQEIVEKEKLGQIHDESSLRRLVQEAIQENQKSAEDYRSGKEQALMFLVGQVMRKTKGSANPATVHHLLRENLQEEAKK